MKNDLTSIEWQVLNDYLRLGFFAFSKWENEGKLEEKNDLFESAMDKFNKAAEGEASA